MFSVSWRGFVVKEDGLCAGKGVTVTRDRQDALRTLRAVYSRTAEARVVLEEMLEGFEVSALCLSDGHTTRMLPLAQDHKRAAEGDRGPNTGGMGAVAPVTLPARLHDQVQHLLQHSVDCMAREGRPYKGVLYAGLMVCADGPRVLEFNCRFGDPETQVGAPSTPWRTPGITLRYKRERCVRQS